MTQRESALEVYFYVTSSGNEPVREWLKELPKEDKKTIGYDIKQFNMVIQSVCH